LVARAARQLNSSVVDHVVKTITAHLKGTTAERPFIAVLGLAFKGEPATTDRRGSFGLALVEALRGKLADAAIRTWEPTGESVRDARLDDVVRGADVVIIANNHAMHRALDVRNIAGMLRPNAMIYDACGSLQPALGMLPNGARLHVFGSASDLGWA
jgi:UDP-N-acetyl-D-mannosaminuronate dehydrogenase